MGTKEYQADGKRNLSPLSGRNFIAEKRPVDPPVKKKEKK